MRATRLDAAVFDALASTNGEDLISVFLPTHKKGRDIAQDRIHLKNQLSAAEEVLAGLGWKPRQRSQRLSKARDLLDDLEFWEHQEAGLAVYIDDRADVVAVSSTRPLETVASVMPVFMLRPLAADLHKFNIPVLALTKDQVALFTASEVEVNEIPAELPSYDDVNWFVDREKERQQHPDHVGTDRGRHGHEPAERRDEDLARFLREVDAAIEVFEADTPIIVLGDDDVVARYAHVSRRPTLSRPNSGIRAPFSSDEILDRVDSIVADLDRQRIEEALSTARDQLGVDMATVEIEEAIPASAGGRVERVVVDRTATAIWGRFDEMSQKVEVHDAHQPGDVDLLDRLVVWSRGNGAEIVSTDTGVDGRSFVATFRY
jgi:hypothetical protein